MTQHNYVIANGTGAAVRAAINLALQALASQNAGPDEPATTYAYMLWPDTTNDLLKMRNGADSGWISLGQLGVANLGHLTTGDLAGYVTKALFNANTILAATADDTPAALTIPEQTVLGRITGGVIAALTAAQIRTLINVADGANAYVHPNHSGDVTSAGDGAMTIGAGKVLEAMIGAGAVTEGKLGTGAVTEGKVGAAAIAQSKLKTSTGSVSVTDNSAHVTRAGGAYAFEPLFSATAGDIHVWTANASFLSGLSGTGNIASTAYMFLSFIPGNGSGYVLYASNTYVTSSGEVFWIYILRDKASKKIIATYAAPDHPCLGNGGKPLVVPHPFGNYNPAKHEIVVVNPDESELQELVNRTVERDEAKADRSLLQVILEDYEIDEQGGSPDWPMQAVTVGLPPNVDWKRMPEGTLVTPIRKAIPPMGFLKTKTLRLK